MAFEYSNIHNKLSDGLNDGPLSKEEATRRAKVYLFNRLSDIFESEKSEFVMNFDSEHPETRQVAAYGLKLLIQMSRELFKETKIEAVKGDSREDN